MPGKLRVIPCKQGLVGLTTSRMPEEELKTIIDGLPRSTSDICRVLVFGDPQHDPISMLWFEIEQLTAALPDAFDRVMIERHANEPELQVPTLVYRLASSASLRVLSCLRPTHLGASEFIPVLAPLHREITVDGKNSIRLAVDSLRNSESHVDVVAVEAGLYLMNDCLDESHQCSQSIEGKGRHRCGDYWHAIMHRRETDYGNAKYWFRRVGQHPLFEELTEIADCVISQSGETELKPLTAKGWDPMRFVDLCERHADNETSTTALVLREIQGWEMALLLKQSMIDAVGSTPHPG